MHDVSVRAARHKACAKRVLEHIRGTAGILTDYDLRLFTHVLSVIPAEEAAYLHRVLEGKILVGFASEAVGSEIFAHQSAFLSTTSPLFLKMQFSGMTPRTQDVG